MIDSICAHCSEEMAEIKKRTWSRQQTADGGKSAVEGLVTTVTDFAGTHLQLIRFDVQQPPERDIQMMREASSIFKESALWQARFLTVRLGPQGSSGCTVRSVFGVANARFQVVVYVL